MFNGKQLTALAIWWLLMGLALYGALESMTIDLARITFWLYVAIWPVMAVFSMLKAFAIVFCVMISGLLILALLGALDDAPADSKPQTFYRPRHMPD